MAAELTLQKQNKTPPPTACLLGVKGIKIIQNAEQRVRKMERSEADTDGWQKNIILLDKEEKRINRWEFNEYYFLKLIGEMFKHFIRRPIGNQYWNGGRLYSIQIARSKDKYKNLQTI